MIKKFFKHISLLGTSETDSIYLREKISLLNVFWFAAGVMFVTAAVLSAFDDKAEVVAQIPFRILFFVIIYFLMRFKKINIAMYLFIIGLFLSSFYSALTLPHQNVFTLVCFVLIAVSYYIIESKAWNISFLIITILAFLYMRYYQIEYQVPVFDTSYIVSIVFIFVSIYLILVLYKLEHNRLTIILEKQNEKLIHSDNVKNNLLSILSHDLRSPLVSITSLITLILEEDEIKTGELNDMFVSIKNRSDLTLHLMDQILNWAYTQVEGFKLIRNTVTIKNIFTEELMMLESSIEKKGPKIINTINNDITVFADLQIFKTVIRNIISNAIKYVNPGDEITFSAEQKEDGVEIIISDNGIGIHEKKLNQIFTKKTDGEPGTSNEIGSGLGLLISNDFIMMHHGKITINSELGKGTTVLTFWPNKKTS